MDPATNLDKNARPCIQRFIDKKTALDSEFLIEGLDVTLARRAIWTHSHNVTFKSFRIASDNTTICVLLLCIEIDRNFIHEEHDVDEN